MSGRSTIDGKAGNLQISRAYFAADVGEFLLADPHQVLGTLVAHSVFPVDLAQRYAWEEEIRILKDVLPSFQGAGKIYFEYSVPRLGKRIDVLLILGGSILVLEFKIGDRTFSRQAHDQVWDYAIDLKNFHESSHDKAIAPILVATRASEARCVIEKSAIRDGVFRPILTTPSGLTLAIRQILDHAPPGPIIAREWEGGRYRPTPTIVEAAMALYARHKVEEISRNDAGAKNLNVTTSALEEVISRCKANNRKAICFVTGVPGAGKTLVGLNIATAHADAGELHSVFLSGNGPLVSVMQEALARDQVRREAEAGRRITKGVAATRVKAFVQNVHHFRDEYTQDSRAPADHIAVFDEAQRAWNAEQTEAFMARKRNRPGFGMSEPEFLISCLDRHRDWAVIVCLVGGGQEINTGEAGIGGWVDALKRSFPAWEVHISPELRDAEYSLAGKLETLPQESLKANPDLHLAVSMRSYRAEHVSELVKSLLDFDIARAKSLAPLVSETYPIVLCRSVERARRWLRTQARGNERYGLIVSSQAYRLRPHAIHVKAPLDPVHWFLGEKEDIRSSYYLEDVATEFHVQGLELDWAAVVWDGDFRVFDRSWRHFSFVGTKWQRINAPERRSFQKNAYRVLLTRARQGMVIVVPEGDSSDSTRLPEYYDETFEYLSGLGLPGIDEQQA